MKSCRKCNWIYLICWCLGRERQRERKKARRKLFGGEFVSHLCTRVNVSSILQHQYTKHGKSIIDIYVWWSSTSFYIFICLLNRIFAWMKWATTLCYGVSESDDITIYIVCSWQLNMVMLSVLFSLIALLVIIKFVDDATDCLFIWSFFALSPSMNLWIYNKRMPSSIIEWSDICFGLQFLFETFHIQAFRLRIWWFSFSEQIIHFNLFIMLFKLAWLQFQSTPRKSVPWTLFNFAYLFRSFPSQWVKRKKAARKGTCSTIGLLWYRPPQVVNRINANPISNHRD